MTLLFTGGGLRQSDLNRGDRDLFTGTVTGHGQPKKEDDYRSVFTA